MTPRGAVALRPLSQLRRIVSPREVQRAGVFAILLLVAVVSLPAQAHAWGCGGHQAVALLAEKYLTAHALATVKQILADAPIDPGLSRYCKEGGADPLANASTWADDIRGSRPETGPWHYIDIPLGTTRRDVEKYCDPKEGCVVQAITAQLAILRSSDATPSKRGDALRFVIHFVGDIHQPLHGTTNNDQGGNCVPVAFFGTLPQLRNPQAESYSPNLHGVWDTNILERATTGQTVEQVAADLDRSLGKKIAHWKQRAANVDVWAWESYELAQKVAYGRLPVSIPVETPQSITNCADDNHVSARMLKLDERLGDSYQNDAVPIVRERLAQAGARLALLLNQLWP